MLEKTYYCIIVYHIILYCIVLYFIALHCTLLHCIALYCIVLHSIVLYCIYFIVLLTDPLKNSTHFLGMAVLSLIHTVLMRSMTFLGTLGVVMSVPRLPIITSVSGSSCEISIVTSCSSNRTTGVDDSDRLANAEGKVFKKGKGEKDNKERENHTISINVQFLASKQ